VLLTPLARTSFNRAVKAMGAKRWQALHRLVYAIAGLGILHFFWMRAAKNNFAEVAVYAAILAVLLGWRVREALRKRQAPGSSFSFRTWSAKSSRSRMRWASAPSTRTSGGRPRVL
jgi:sulfoxide reductase heme-binding subunit YedZ